MQTNLRNLTANEAKREEAAQKRKKEEAEKLAQVAHEKEVCGEIN